MAEAGSNATNIIQAAADKDLAEIKRISLLNNRAFLTEKDGRAADFTYCDGSEDYSACSNCPCNPLASVTPDFTITGSGPTIKDTECTAIALNNSDIKEFEYTTDQTTCKSFYDGLGVGSLGAEGMYLLRKASLSTAVNPLSLKTVTSVVLTYAVKSPKQFADNNFSLSTKHNLAVQGLIVTAQTEDFSDTIPISSGAWGGVLVPNTP